MLFRMVCVWALALVFVGGPLVARDWLRWGGPNGDFTVATSGLAETWPDEGPEKLWKRALGDGYSSILYKDSRLFTMYRDGEDEITVCLDAATGKTIWEDRYRRTLWSDMLDFETRFTKGPNATPLIMGNRIIAIGIEGRMRCLDLSSGKLLWERRLSEAYGRRKRVEEYGYSASPLPYRGKLIVQVGGDEHGVVAFDPKDGAVVWTSDASGVSYAQASLISLGGVDQYVFFSPRHVIGLDPATGRYLWRHRIPVDNGNHLTPVVRCSENELWVSSQFDSGGGRLLEISREGTAWQSEQRWFKSKLRGSCWTLIRIGDHIYGSAGGHNVSLLTAFNWRTGEIAWQERGYHMAQCLYADGKLIFLTEGGNLHLARISPERFELLAGASVTDAVSWTLPTLIETTLYIRDKQHIMALNLGRDAH